MDLTIVELALGLGGILIANFGWKLGRAYNLVKQAFELTKNQKEARKDGKLTQAEKAVLYDDIEDVITEAYKVLKGFFPNKSKK